MIHILDSSKYQTRFLGPANVPPWAWDPLFWDPSVIDWDALAQEADGVILRIADGYNQDPVFQRCLVEVKKHFKWWGVYYFFRPGLDPIRQADLCWEWLPELPPLGVWCDLEDDGALGELALFQKIQAFLGRLDTLYGCTTGIYSGAWFLDPNLSLDRQKLLAHRPGWFAAYPNLRVPRGWSTWTLHQDSDRHPWAGVGPADHSYLREGLALYQVRIPNVVEALPMNAGTKIGLHVIRPNQARQILEQGDRLAFVLSVENAGLLLEARALDPLLPTLWRLFTPEWDACQDIHLWSFSQVAERATTIVDYAASRWNGLSPQERAAIDYVVLLNEADPEGVIGWAIYGNLCRQICEQAQAAGLRVALPAFNAGTPEYLELLGWLSSKVVEAIDAGGHALVVHEGLNPWSPLPLAFDTRPIPGAPYLPLGAGSEPWRYRYLYDHLFRGGLPLPRLFVTEFYAGGGYDHPQDALLRWQVYDHHVRQDPFLVGFAPFTADPDEAWANQDYTPVYLLDEFRQYVASIRESPNPTEFRGYPLHVEDADMIQYILTVDDSISLGVLQEKLGATNIFEVRISVPVNSIPEPPQWWELWPEGIINPPRPLKIPNKVMTFYKRDGQPFNPQPLTRVVNWTMQVVERRANLLNIFDQAGDVSDWFVRAQDVQPA